MSTLDGISFILRNSDAIDAFECDDATARPWVYAA
jgi:hypothetical protein